MSESRIERIQRLFLSALEIPEDEREKWLAEECGDDAALLEEVLTLLQHDEPSKDPLENPLHEAIADAGALEKLEGAPGDTCASDEELAKALHVRCPHCHNPIELVDDSSFAEIECPSCGSSFSLLGEETVPHDQPDRKAIAHYALQERVGTGAFGSVWKAHDENLDRIVAVKIPRKGQLSRAESALFLREARSAAQLKHPNIVSVHEVGRDEDQVYIVSDFIDGEPLSSWLTRRPLTPKEGAGLIAQIAHALHHAHEAGVIHRDLKPANVIMDSAGEPHLVDFGLAKRAAGEITMTADGKILGTPAYMSPELARGEASTVDRRSDVYSLGVVLFEVLTGEKPFRGDVRMLLHQVLHDEAPGPRTLNTTVPRDLDTICLKCLQKAPEQRYATAEDLASDLERYVKGVPISARPISTLARFGRWCQRNPKVATLVGTVFLLLVLVAVGGIVSSYLIDSERKAAVENETEAKRQERLAKEERDKVKQLRSDAVNDLISLQLSNGARVTDEGDGAIGLLWFTKALATAESAGLNTDIHRLRVANLASKLPRPLALFNVAAPMASSADEFTLDGRYRAIGSRGDLEQLLGMTRSEIEKYPEGFTPEQRTLYLQYQSGRPRELTIWDMRNNRQIGKPIGNDEPIWRWYWSQDGKRLVTEFLSTCRVWDRDTGEAVSPLISGVVPGTSTDPRATFLFASSRPETWEGPDGRRITPSSAERKLTALDVESGRQLYEVTLKDGAGFKLSPTGERLAVFGSEEVQILRASDGSLIRPMLGRPIDPGDKFKSVTFSPDETLLAANCGVTGSKPDTLWIWSIETGEALANGLPEDVAPQSFSANGTMLLALRRISLGRQHGNTARLWNTSTGEPETREFPQEANVSHAVLSPDGRLVATASNQGEVQVWKIGERTRNQGSSVPRTTELACPRIWHNSPVNGLRFSADGKRLFIGGEKGVSAWELPPKTKHEGTYGHSIVLSQDGSRAVYCHSTNSQTPQSLDLRTGTRTDFRSPGAATKNEFLGEDEYSDGRRRSVDRVRGPWLGEKGRFLVSVSSNTDVVASKTHLLTRSYTSRLRVWNSITGMPVSDPFEQSGLVRLLRISPDGNRIAVLTMGQQVQHILRIRKLGLGEPVDLPFGSSVLDMVFSRDSARIVLARRDSIELLDADSGGVLKKLVFEQERVSGSREYYNEDLPRQIQLSSDGRRLAAIFGSVAQVLDAGTLEPISPTIPHQTRITHIAFDRSGRYVATVSLGGRADIWDAETGEAICPPLMHSFVLGYCDFSPDGRLLLTVGREDARVWEVSTGIPVLREAGKFNSIQDAAFSSDGRSIFFVADGQIVEQEILDTDQPKEVLESIAEVLAGGNQIDKTGTLSQLSPNSVSDKLSSLQNDYPSEFASYEDGIPDSANQPPIAIAPFSANHAANYQKAWAKHLGVEVETTNSVGIKMRVIPPGLFLMGASDIEVNQVWTEARKSGRRYPGFLRPRLVTLSKPYMLSDREITRGQFRKFVKATGFRTDAERNLQGGFGWRNDGWSQDHTFHWNTDLGFEQTDDHPVVNVSWNDAVAFCQWLSEEEGVDYHLPTEAQWEFACRAGTVTPYNFGIDGSRFEQFAWVGDSNVGAPSLTGQLNANPFGLYDMHGNVMEWCLDGYLGPGPNWNLVLPSTHLVDPLTLRSDPLPIQPRTGARDGDPFYYRATPSRVARGGDFFNSIDFARSAARQGRSPTHRSFVYGFRVASGGLVLKHQSMSESLHKEGIQTAVEDRQRIELRGQEVGDADLESLAGSDQLLMLDLANTAITSEALKHLANCRNLQLLDVDNTAVIDDGLNHVSGLKRLTTLHLSGTGVTDQGLRHFAGLVNLQRLDLKDTAITGTGLAYLKDLSLRTLNLTDTKIDFPGLENVAKLESLERLYLNGTPVTDAGLVEISRLQELKYLHLAGTQITDEGLGHLGNLPNLRVLTLDETKITSRGIKTLEALSELASLSLTGTDLGDEAIEDLSLLTGLLLLDIRDTQISETGVRTLRKKLRPFTEIRH